MKSRSQQNSIALLLMVSSLLLLGVFLSFWLKNQYAQVVATLQERSSFVFINTLREAESQYYQKQVLPSLLDMVGSDKANDAVHLKAFKIKMTDDNENTTFFEAKDSTNISLETKVTINVETEQTTKSNESLGNMITWLVADFHLDSMENNYQHKKDSLIDISIKKMIADAPKIRELPSSYKIVKVDSNANRYSRIILSDVYKDHDSGDRFALAFNKTSPYILKKIGPELAFAFILFATTSLAFWFIYKSLRNQQRLTELKNDLISNITHELKTPISTVGVAIEALQNFGALEDPKRTKEYLDISQKELNRLSILVDKVLNTSLFEKPNFTVKKEPVNLQSLVQSVLDSMKLHFQNKEAAVDFSMEGHDFELLGDKLHLTSVVYNLIDNALKYSPLNPKLKLKLFSNQNNINFSIQDNGLGIPKQFQDKIFDKFFRVPTGNAHTIKGHGLGLNYVKKVVERHGGSISVASEQGKGTEFRLSFPNSSL